MDWFPERLNIFLFLYPIISFFYVGNWWSKLENELKQYKVIGADKNVTGSNLLCPAQNNPGAEALTIWDLLK